MEKPHIRPDVDTTDESPEGRGGPRGEDLLVVSNRQPYSHGYDDEGEIVVDRPAGGLTAGIDAVMRQIDGVWIAWGDGEADTAVVDDDDRVTVPPDAEGGQYALQRLWLTDEQVENYYYGFSNQVLWPICHSALTNVDCDGRFWEHYEHVNERFADAIVESAGAGSTIWIHDYHFGLAPAMVSQRVPDSAFLLHTWHIPWPSWDVFRACPRRTELLRGLLGNDLVGFHVPRYCENFLECVAAALPEAHVDWDSYQVVYRGETTTVRAFPMGVPAEEINREAADTEGFAAEFRADHGIDAETRLAVGVDRLDYTKGIPQRIDALERLWETTPRWRESLTYVQVASESRSQIEAYQQVQTDVEAAVERVNERFGTEDWQPIVYTTAHLPDEGLYALYADADAALVSPIRDGMNLVAQEYVAAQQDNGGALVLSDQAGAHDEIGEWALSINPHDTDSFAAAIDEALTLPPEERRERMHALRRYVATNDIDTWMDDIFGTIDALRRERAQETPHASV